MSVLGPGVGFTSTRHLSPQWRAVPCGKTWVPFLRRERNDHRQGGAEQRGAQGHGRPHRVQAQTGTGPEPPLHVPELSRTSPTLAPRSVGKLEVSRVGVGETVAEAGLVLRKQGQMFGVESWPWDRKGVSGGWGPARVWGPEAPSGWFIHKCPLKGPCEAGESLRTPGPARLTWMNGLHLRPLPSQNPKSPDLPRSQLGPRHFLVWGQQGIWVF